MPTYPCPVDTKVEMLPELCEEIDATLEPAFSTTVSTMRWVDRYAGIRAILCLLNVRTKVIKVLINRKIFLLVTSFCCLQVSFFRSKGKCSHL